MSDDVQSFKDSCNIVSSHIAKITRRSRSIDNLHRSKKHIHHNNKCLDVWLPCCRLGVPCTSRIVALMEPNRSHRGKEMVVACSEIKYCLHST